MKQRQQKRGPAPLASSEETTVDHSTEQGDDHENSASSSHKNRNCRAALLVQSQYPIICVDDVCRNSSNLSDSVNHKVTQKFVGPHFVNSCEVPLGEKSRLNDHVKRESVSSIGSDLILPLSGRSSRLSSICSNISGSRSVSPHFTQLETSFCGSKPALTSSDHFPPVPSPVCMSPMICLSLNDANSSTVDPHEPASVPSSAKQSSDAASYVMSSSSKSLDSFKLTDAPNNEAVLAHGVCPSETISPARVDYENFADFSKFDEINNSHTISSYDAKNTENIHSQRSNIYGKNNVESELVGKLTEIIDPNNYPKISYEQQSIRFNLPQYGVSSAINATDTNDIVDISNQLVKKVLSSALLNTNTDETSSKDVQTSEQKQDTICRSPSSSSERQSVKSDSISASLSENMKNKSNEIVNSGTILEATKLFTDDDEGEFCYVPTTLPQEFPLQNRMLPISERRSNIADGKLLLRQRIKTSLPSHDLNEFITLPPEANDCKVKIILPNEKIYSLNAAKHKHIDSKVKENGQQICTRNVQMDGNSAMFKNYINHEELILFSNKNNTTLNKTNEIFSSSLSKSEIVISPNMNFEGERLCERKKQYSHNTNEIKFSTIKSSAPTVRSDLNNQLTSSDLYSPHHPNVPRSPVEEEAFAIRRQLIRERASSSASIVHEQTNRMVEIMQDAAAAYLEPTSRNSTKKHSLGNELQIHDRRSRSRSPTHSLEKSRSPSPHKLQMETSFCGSGRSSVSETISVEELINLSHACGNTSPDFQVETSDIAVSASSSIKRRTNSSRNGDFLSSRKESDLYKNGVWDQGAEIGSTLVQRPLASAPHSG